MSTFLVLVMFEILSWLILILWGILHILTQIKKAIVFVWKRKELVKRNLLNYTVDAINEGRTKNTP